MSEWKKLGTSEEGTMDPPGGYYNLVKVEVYRRGDRWKLHLEEEDGSNQGSLQPHNWTERQYRADSLSDLMRISISEVRSDEGVTAKYAVPAIREACFEAEDELEKLQSVG